MKGAPSGSKVLALSELAERRSAFAVERRKVVLTNGCFDLLHIGHIGYLEQAAGLGDLLIVALNSDDSVRRLKGAQRPLVPESERAQILAALGCVDFVTIFDEDTPERVYRRLRPDILVKGGDWKPEQLPGREIIQEYGGEIVILPYREGISTTALVARIQNHDPRRSR